VRVALAAERGVARLTSGKWHLTDAAGHLLVRPAAPGSGWGIERRGRRVRAIHADGFASAWVDGTAVLRDDGGHGFTRWNGRRYRGTIGFVATDSATLVVNILDVEDYLRGVVPLEIGSRTAAEQAAVEAQAVAARSYTFLRMTGAGSRPYDLTTGAIDQVYGGADAETPVADAAVKATEGLVLSYDGRAISAPYHSSCGGTTAEQTEVWRTTPLPYLRRVSDRVPGTDRYYCDIAPRFRWERTFTGSSLGAAVERYLRGYASAPAGPLGEVRDVRADGLTPSGRVAGVVIATERGTYHLRGNDVRFVLRSVGGDLLPSTYFSLEPVIGRDGRVMQLAVRGTGNGHGVGMCQWGAIGRARAGQDVRTILRTYYPGTTLARGA
jgi:stage II sporulation protein D